MTNSQIVFGAGPLRRETQKRGRTETDTRALFFPRRRQKTRNGTLHWTTRRVALWPVGLEKVDLKRRGENDIRGRSFPEWRKKCKRK